MEAGELVCGADLPSGALGSRMEQTELKDQRFQRKRVEQHLTEPLKSCKCGCC